LRAFRETRADREGELRRAEHRLQQPHGRSDPWQPNAIGGCDRSRANAGTREGHHRLDRGGEVPALASEHDEVVAAYDRSPGRLTHLGERRSPQLRCQSVSAVLVAADGPPAGLAVVPKRNRSRSGETILKLV